MSRAAFGDDVGDASEEEDGLQTKRKTYRISTHFKHTIYIFFLKASNDDKIVMR